MTSEQSAAGTWVIEATAENFATEVIERSRQVPVLVDFWAAWCQPCRLLGPLLEKLADEFSGKFVLVKADTEGLPELAASFGVQSIPAVFAVRDGAVVDGFVGLLDEASAREFIQRLLPTPAEEQLAQGRNIEADDPVAAAACYRQALELDPRLDAARIALGRAELAQNNLAAAQQIVAALEARGFLEPEAERLRADLELRLAGQQSGGVEAAREAVDAQPDDLNAQLRLAQALAAAGQAEEALGLALSLVQRDRHGLGEPARQLMVDLFHTLPADSELTREYRRKLSAALY